MCTRRVLHPLKWGHLGGKAFVGSASALPALLQTICGNNLRTYLLRCALTGALLQWVPSRWPAN